MDIKEAAHRGAAQPGADTTVRRRILAAGLSGAALSLLPWLGGRSGAGAAGQSTTATSNALGTSGTSGDATGGTTGGATGVPTGGATGVPTGGATGATTGGTTASSDAATTATAPPKRPTPEDLELLKFAQQMELTIRNLYDVAINAKLFSDLDGETVKAIREAHEGYEQAISGLIGRFAPNSQIDKLYEAMKADFSGDPKKVAAKAAALEDTAVATHTDIVGKLIGIDAAALISSMLVVEARHASVLRHIGGATKFADQLVNDGSALSPSDYPVK